MFNTDLLQCQKSFSTSFTEKYFTNSFGSNCPLDGVISIEAKCKQAASQLGLNYRKQRPGPRYPAGCYSDDLGTVYFNSIIDPSLTANLYGHWGAICVGGGTHMIFIPTLAF